MSDLCRRSTSQTWRRGAVTREDYIQNALDSDPTRAIARDAELNVASDAGTNVLVGIDSRFEIVDWQRAVGERV